MTSAKQYPRSAPASTVPAHADIVVVGAGFGGLYAHYRFRQLGLSLFGFEQGSDVGGTWYWNRYPGARCDVESVDYTYSFSPELLEEWQWSERFSTQPEILEYASYVADKFDLRREIRFGAKIVSATFDEASNLWTVRTAQGDAITCQWLVTTVGCLSVPKDPDFEGLASFKGQWVQTGAWPKQQVDWAGKNVLVIGTGSSAVQTIPEVASTAGHLTVFQRTANYSVPAKNGPLPEHRRKQVFADYPGYLDQLKKTRGGQLWEMQTDQTAADFNPEEQQARLRQAWELGRWNIQGCFRDIMMSEDTNQLAAEFVHARIRETVKDPATAEKLIPRNHPLGSKRMCLDSDYFETFNRDNVDLVDINEEPFVLITETGLETSAKHYPADLIIFAIGFDAMTGPLTNLGIVGRGGQALKDAWADGAESYLGLAMPGFPNLFTVNGPSSPSVLTNMIVSIEQHVDWIATSIESLREQGVGRIEARRDATHAWAEHTREVAGYTLFPQANSWYMGANVPGKPRLFLAYLGGFDNYSARCDAIAANGFEGFDLASGKVEQAA